MPIIMRHRRTGEIAAAHLRNSYDLPYYGALWWGDMAIAEAAMAGTLADEGIADPEQWELCEVNESRLKLMNVKLNNDPRRKIVLDHNGLLQVAAGQLE